MPRATDRNSIDRLPTRVETTVGLLCSILLILLGSSAFSLVIWHLPEIESISRGVAVALIVSGTLAITGLFFALRILFTPATRPTVHGIHLLSVVLIGIGLLSLAAVITGKVSIRGVGVALVVLLGGISLYTRSIRRG